MYTYDYFNIGKGVYINNDFQNNNHMFYKTSSLIAVPQGIPVHTTDKDGK